MSKVERFEDPIAWQKARVLAKEIYATTKQGSFAKDFGLAGQIQRAAVSVMSNIAEGFERRGRAEFHHFLFTAKGSCAELRSQLYLALDVGHLEHSGFKRLMGMAEEVAKVVGGLRASVERQRDAQQEKR